MSARDVVGLSNCSCSPTTPHEISLPGSGNPTTVDFVVSASGTGSAKFRATIVSCGSGNPTCQNVFKNPAHADTPGSVSFP
jgi:hypothetical protein